MSMRLPRRSSNPLTECPMTESDQRQLGKGKRQNQLSDEHIARIIETYQKRPAKPIERYARRVAMKEIEANEFNLNISRYVSTAEAEQEIDLAATHKKLVDIEKEI